jgi:hypothetical protein
VDITSFWHTDFRFRKRPGSIVWLAKTISFAIIPDSPPVSISLSLASLIGGTPYDYVSYDYAPVYDYRFWQDLAMKVQSELARRGYYHGPIDGVIGTGSRQAIRGFQEAKGLPVTGLIDPNVLRALKLPIPRVSLRSS